MNVDRFGVDAVGPPERDLFMFMDTPDDAFLRRYRDAAGGLHLHARLIAFYHYRWAVQEIADYATRLLFGPSSQAEEEHAWAELQPYLPVPHRQIEDAVSAAEAVTWRVGGRWA